MDHRHQRHVAVGGHRHRAQQVRGENGGQVNGGRSVRPADDADRRRFLGRETEQVEGAERGDENAQLGRRAEQQGDRSAQQRPEVGQRAHPHENHRRQQLGLDAHAVDQLQQRHGLTGFRMIAAGGTEHGRRQIGEHRAKADGDQQQRLVVFLHRQIDQQPGDPEHEQILPGQAAKAALGDQFRQGIHVNRRGSGWVCRRRPRYRVRR